MNFNNLFTDDDAVSPVIGVILMVAITVILAAVIGTFVLGLGDQVSNTSPTASFTFDFSDSNGELAITHDGGNSIPASQLTIVAQGASYNNGNLGAATSSTSWEAASGSSDDVTAGSSVTIVEDTADGLNGATVRMTWQSSNGGDTATLGKWTGPDA
ncbi:type IV pilin [Haloglomus halophilum]|uniref:type IV pilin n=1 Tax=Haloglomus halophilum TaxID=2962672 RepID=UPI0020C9EDF3|nr:type IV pilin N-terminal domain-containing protein [Haloglomus halophilum]